jgi:hypothetical protein
MNEKEDASLRENAQCAQVLLHSILEDDPRRPALLHFLADRYMSLYQQEPIPPTLPKSLEYFRGSSRVGTPWKFISGNYIAFSVDLSGNKIPREMAMMTCSQQQ